MKKIIAIVLCFVLALPSISGFASDCKALVQTINDTVTHIVSTVTEPQVGSVGGEWVILGLARSDCEIPESYYQTYLANLENTLTENNGVLHEKKYTEYSRVILALTVLGKNPEDAAGYNLLLPLGDLEKTVLQGINGAIWALIALDSADYTIPQNPNAATRATRDLYLSYILERQLTDGGWALSGDVSDPDITGMALTALSGYQDRSEVKAATERALSCMADRQLMSGGFKTNGTETLESSAQMLVALCSLGISPEDTRFVKNGNTLFDSLLSYQLPQGGFSHIKDGGYNQMATEQALYAMVALNRSLTGKNTLYQMTDAVSLQATPSVGLPNKHKDVQITAIIAPKTFSDIHTHPSKTAVEALAARGIIHGKTDTAFDPYGNMTRAEFAAILTRGLQLPLRDESIFSDVILSDWFFSYVATANAYGIVNGIGDGIFNPYGTITRQEAAVMVARAAALCGMQTELSLSQSRDVLAGFIDYIKAADWAVPSLAFCCREGILDDSALEILPEETVTRAEIAQMLYQMLQKAKLL